MKFINGSKNRVIRQKIQCIRCNQLLDESEFYFSTSGYSSYCISCHREYLKENREKHRDELVGQNGVTRHKRQPEVTEVEWMYKKELEDIARTIHAGDQIMSSGRVFTVVSVTGRYVVLQNQYGVRESYLYDDMHKILKNKYKFRGEDDEES